MNQEEFHYISQLLKKRSGLALSDDKLYLLESRLMPVARSCGKQDLESFIRFLRQTPDEAIIREVVDAMTTNESLFFRDQKPFEQLKHCMLPRIRAHKPAGKIRLWSAACSTGQEPYSLAITLLEEGVKLAGYTFEIIATDISQRVLEKAKQGIYTQFEVQRGLPIQILLKYFTQLPDNNWQIKDHVKQMVQFRPFNLLEEYAPLGRFDIIFCRNVLIYFDEPTKAQVLDKLSRILEPHGILLLGSTESILGLTQRYGTLDNERGVHVIAA